jgi:hypothetical protein
MKTQRVFISSSQLQVIRNNQVLNHAEATAVGESFCNGGLAML